MNCSRCKDRKAIWNGAKVVSCPECRPPRGATQTLNLPDDDQDGDK